VVFTPEDDIIQIMKAGNVVLCLAGGLFLHAQSHALTSEAGSNPYANIVDRNVFGLRPPPPPTAVAPPETPAPNITLQGIVSIPFGKKQVLFKTMMPGAAGQPPKEMSLAMSEGERMGEVEVLEINEAAGTIRFRNHGKEQLKDLSKDGVKAPAGPVAAAPGLPAVHLPAVPGVPTATVPPAVPSGGSGVTTFGGNSGNVNIPGRPMRLTPPNTGTAAGTSMTPQAERPLSPEEQTILMEVNRKLTADKVQKGELPPLPPTELTPPTPPQ
jgi:hypothetical protein